MVLLFPWLSLNSIESSPIEEFSPFAGQQLNADAVVVEPPVTTVVDAVVVVVPDCVTVALALYPDAIAFDWAISDEDGWGTVIASRERFAAAV